MESGLSGLPRGQVVVSEAVPWRPWLGQVESKPVMTEPTLTPLAWSGEDIQEVFSEGLTLLQSPHTGFHALLSGTHPRPHDCRPGTNNAGMSADTLPLLQGIQASNLHTGFRCNLGRLHIRK